MATTQQNIRTTVLSFMAGIPGPGSEKDEEVFTRPDGVREFERQWVVSDVSGVVITARLSDRDDVIEFGVLRRDEALTSSVLNATLVLDEDEVLLNVMSEVNSELNFDMTLSDENLEPLQKSLLFYAQCLGHNTY